MREPTRVRKPSRRPAAFTLIEVLLVLIILVILGSLAANIFTGTQDKANVKSTIIQIGFIEDAIDRYRLEMNQYPEKLEDLWEEPSDDDEAQRWGSAYMEKVEEDNWGNPYEYLSEGEKNPDKYDLWSDGPDGEDGTEDDIGNWKNEDDNSTSTR